MNPALSVWQLGSIADLTEREIEVIRWGAQGKNNVEIMNGLVISEKAVNFDGCRANGAFRLAHSDGQLLTK